MRNFGPVPKIGLLGLISIRSYFCINPPYEPLWEGPDLAVTNFTFFDCNTYRFELIQPWSSCPPPPARAPLAYPLSSPATGVWTGTSAPTTRQRTAGTTFFLFFVLLFLYLQERHPGHWRQPPRAEYSFRTRLLSKGVQWN